MRYIFYYEDVTRILSVLLGRKLWWRFNVTYPKHSHGLIVL